MKSLLFVLALSVIVACKKNTRVENNSLVGKWKLTESYADPGDGSGKWQKTDPSNPHYLEFTSDGKLISWPADIYNSDHYQVTSDSTMIFIRGTERFPMRYIFTKTLLTLFTPCIEVCGSKYIPVEN